jgi:hypothetical protein
MSASPSYVFLSSLRRIFGVTQPRPYGRVDDPKFPQARRAPAARQRCHAAAGARIVPWRQPGDWALNYLITSTAPSRPDPDFLASAVAPAAEVRAWVGIGSLAGPVVRGRMFAPVAGPAGELWQQKVRVVFGSGERVEGRELAVTQTVGEKRSALGRGASGMGWTISVGQGQPEGPLSTHGISILGGM